jgi:hypothetical protein
MPLYLWGNGNKVFFFVSCEILIFFLQKFWSKYKLNLDLLSGGPVI